MTKKHPDNERTHRPQLESQLLQEEQHLFKLCSILQGVASGVVYLEHTNSAWFKLCTPSLSRTIGDANGKKPDYWRKQGQQVDDPHNGIYEVHKTTNFLVAKCTENGKRRPKTGFSCTKGGASLDIGFLLIYLGAIF